MAAAPSERSPFAPSPDDAYLDGFVAGLEFVLLAMEGRGVDGPEARGFRRDYERLVRAWRASRGSAAVPASAMAALLRN